MIKLLLAMILPMAISLPRSFDDRSYREFLANSAASHSRAIIYTWSPHMVRSKVGLREISDFAKAHGYALQILLDPLASQRLAAASAAKYGWASDTQKKLTSSELIGLEMRVHYPTYLFIRNGKVWNQIPGYKFPMELAKIDREFSK